MRKWKRTIGAVLATAAACGTACFVSSLPCGCAKGGGSGGAATGKTPLLVLVGGTMRPPMEDLAARYEKQTGQKIAIDSGDSGELMIRIETQKKGDIYVCHDPFLSMLMHRGLGHQGWTVALLTPTIVVAKGNPKKIHSVKDLARPGLKLIMTDATHSTMGWVLTKVFDKTGLRDQIEANIVKRTRTGGAAANDVIIGSMDAAIVWDAVAFLRKDKLDAVPIEPQFRTVPGIDAVTSPTGQSYDLGRIKVTLATLGCSKQPEAAKAFVEFVLANKNVFPEKFGFTPAPKDDPVALLQVHCGAGLRYAMDDAAQAFERTRGVKVQVNYAGSGTLISTLQLKRDGDVFIPGDAWYLQQLEKAGEVLSKADVASLVPVIIVRKGNPKGIRSLKDLLADGVKLALGQPDACQIGRLCGQIFQKNKIDPQAVAKNTASTSMTVNELGVWVQTGKVDAAIVWDAVAANFAQSVDVVPIPPEQNLLSTVAAGVLKSSRNRPTAERFVAFLAGDEGRAIFARHHYTVGTPK